MTASNVSIDFKPSITAYAKANGIELTGEGIDSLDAVLRSTMRVNGNQAAFVIGDGRTGTVEDALAIHTEGAPRRVKTAPIADTATARAVARNLASTPEARAAEIVHEHGNPWSPRTISRTRQAAVVNLNPDLATRLKASAGTQP